jgi:hypothetical protein
MSAAVNQLAEEWEALSAKDDERRVSNQGLKCFNYQKKENSPAAPLSPPLQSKKRKRLMNWSSMEVEKALKERKKQKKEDKKKKKLMKKEKKQRKKEEKKMNEKAAKEEEKVRMKDKKTRVLTELNGHSLHCGLQVSFWDPFRRYGESRVEAKITKVFNQSERTKENSLKPKLAVNCHSGVYTTDVVALTDSLFVLRGDSRIVIEGPQEYSSNKRELYVHAMKIVPG